MAYKIDKPDFRSQYIRELHNYVWYRGYKVTENGIILNQFDKHVKPKFAWKDKRIDYVYIDVVENGKVSRISYIRFVYMAWHPEHREFENDSTYIVRTKRNRFDYKVANLELVTQAEHTYQLRKQNQKFSDEEIKEIIDTYDSVKEHMSISEFAKRIGISRTTFYKYRKAVDNGFN